MVLHHSPVLGRPMSKVERPFPVEWHAVSILVEALFKTCVWAAQLRSPAFLCGIQLYDCAAIQSRLVISIDAVATECRIHFTSTPTHKRQNHSIVNNM